VCRSCGDLSPQHGAVARKRGGGGQLDALLSTLENNAVSIDENSSAIELQIAQVEDRLAKCRIASPLTGTGLAQYAEAGGSGAGDLAAGGGSAFSPAIALWKNRFSPSRTTFSATAYGVPSVAIRESVP